MRMVAAMAVVMSACASGGTTSQAGEWQDLLQGGPAQHWRGYRAQALPEGWQMVDGALTRVAQGGDIVTKQQFENFELELEWNVAPGGNSGVFFRGTEANGGIYESAPEMQVLDDAGHSDGQSELTSAGSNFAVHPAPRGAVRPAGQWNRARLVVNGNHVEHWLNGTKVVEYELHSDDWKRRVAASKFAQWRGYGMAPRGHIALQDHGDRVAFRNIRIRVLP